MASIFAEDQAARSEERIAKGIVRTLEDERQRRIAVMRLISNGDIETAEDHIRAAIVLHHTTRIRSKTGSATSLSAENHILAFFMAKRAYELGYERGKHYMAWAYNYYLRACGLEIDIYGYEVAEDQIIAKESSAPHNIAITSCGFNPTDYFDEINNARRVPQ